MTANFGFLTRLSGNPAIYWICLLMYWFLWRINPPESGDLLKLRGLEQKQNVIVQHHFPMIVQ